MDLDELKEKWAEHDQKLETSIRLNRQILCAMKLNQTRSALQRLVMGLALEAVIDLAAIVALGSFIYDNREQGRFAFPAIALDLFEITILTALIRQITLALQVDYGKPIAAIQKQIETLKILRIRYIQGIFLIATLAWTPLLIVGLKGVFGWDVYRLFGPVYLIANLLLGLSIIPLMLWLSKRYGDRIGRWPVIQRLMRNLAGYNLTAATDFLATLSKFEDEQ